MHLNNLKEGPIAQNIQDTLLKQLKKLEDFNIKKAKKAMAFWPNLPLGWPFGHNTPLPPPPRFSTIRLEQILLDNGLKNYSTDLAKIYRFIKYLRNFLGHFWQTLANFGKHFFGKLKNLGYYLQSLPYPPPPPPPIYK